MLLHAERHQQVHTGDSRRTRAGNHHPHVRDVFFHHPQTVENSGGADNGGTVLIVVEDRNIHPLAQLLLDVETLWRFNIFEVDAAKGGLQRGHHVNKFIRIEFVHFDIEHIDTGKFLKEYPLPFHHRLTGQRADIAQPQHRGAVRNNRHQIAARGVFVSRQRIFFDFETGGSNARRVGQRQIALGGEGFGRGNLDFTRNRKFMKIESTLS